MDRGGEKGRGDEQTDPKTRAAQEFQRVEFDEPIDYGHVRVFRMFYDGEPLLEAARQTTDEHAGEEGGIECEFLNRADCEPW